MARKLSVWVTSTAVSVALALVTPPAAAQVGPEVRDMCRATGAPDQACRAPFHLLRTASAVCRQNIGENAVCDALDGNTISEEAVQAQHDSWLGRAIELQRHLDDDLPLLHEVWLHTHNSFNADAYASPTLYGIDPNQVYSISDQLDLGIRAIEIDIHWAPSVAGTPAQPNRVIVCHGTQVTVGSTPVHVGCLPTDPLLEVRLAEVRRWLDAHPKDVVLLYLENQLSKSKEAHDEAARVIQQTLGDLVFRPTSRCAPLPYQLTRRQILDSGHRILLTGNCDVASSTWGDWVHVRGDAWQEQSLSYGDDYPPFPCTKERESHDYEHHFIRRWEDSTGLSDATGGGGDVTVTDAKGETQCGVNLPGLDQLVPFDPRLEAMVWSWAQGEPATSAEGACAYQDASGRLRAASDCRVRTQTVRVVRRGPHGRRKITVETRTLPYVRRPYACWDGTAWHVTAVAERFAFGPEACRREGLGSFRVPHNGYQDELLLFARPSGVDEVWVNYAVGPAGWTPDAAP